MLGQAWDRPCAEINLTTALAATIPSTPVSTVMAYHTSRLRDREKMRRALADVTPVSLSTYLQVTVATLNDTRIGLSRWAPPRRGEWINHRKETWNATPDDLKPFVMSATAVYSARYGYFRDARQGWSHASVTRGSLAKEIHRTHDTLSVVRSAMSAVVCPRIDSWEMVAAAHNAVVQDISPEVVRESVRAASTLLRVFSECDYPVPDLIRSGIPEWAHPLAELEPPKGARP